jgi:hypothetical protein
MLWREAAKIDKLIKDWEMMSEKKKTPELAQNFENLVAIGKEKPNLDPLLPWIWQRVKKGDMTIDHDIISDAQGVFDIDHAVAWFGSRGESRKGVDIMQLDPAAVRGKIEEYDQEIMNKEVKEVERDKSVLYEFKDEDGNPNGYKIRQVQNGDECRTNGQQMGNCLKDDMHRYPEEVDSGEVAILELLDPRDKPQLSVEVRPVEGKKFPNGLADPRGGTLVQVQGRDVKPGTEDLLGNQLPKPEYQRMFREFMDTIDVNDRPGLTTGNPRPISTPRDIAELRAWDEAGRDEELQWGADRLNVGDDYFMDAEQHPHTHGYIQGYGVENEASAAYNVPLRGRTHTRDGEMDVPQLVRNILNGQEYDQETLAYVKDVLEREGKYEDFQAALSELHPELEQHFYVNVYDPASDPMDDPENRTFQQQWRNWPMTHMFDDLNLTRGPDKQPVEPPPWVVHPDQMKFEGMPAPSHLQPQASIKQGIAPVYYRWTFSPRTGVSLGHNEGDLDAFVQYREGSSDSDTNGYAYRIGNGWRLTDWEHRPVEDPYVVSQVVRKLQDREQTGRQRAAARKAPRRVPRKRPPASLWSEVK